MVETGYFLAEDHRPNPVFRDGGIGDEGRQKADGLELPRRMFVGRILFVPGVGVGVDQLGVAELMDVETEIGSGKVKKEGKEQPEGGPYPFPFSVYVSVPCHPFFRWIGLVVCSYEGLYRLVSFQCPLSPCTSFYIGKPEILSSACFQASNFSGSSWENRWICRR